MFARSNPVLIVGCILLTFAALAPLGLVRGQSSTAAGASDSTPAAAAAADMLEATQDAGGDYTLTPNGGGTSQSLDITATNDNGEAESFWLNGSRYDWNAKKRRYYPIYPEPLWHYYVFFRQDDGSYKYEKRNAWDDHLHESGTAKPI